MPLAVRMYRYLAQKDFNKCKCVNEFLKDKGVWNYHHWYTI